MKKIIIIAILFAGRFSNFLFAQTDTALTLSEIMFIQPSGTYNTEFIEIFNTSLTDSFDLVNYKIKYLTYTDNIIATTGGTILKPQQFAVILEGDYDFANGIYNPIIPAGALILKISDNAFGSSGMANTADRTIYLVNTTNDTIDFYTYTANNTAGISDEKIFLNKDNSLNNWGNSKSLYGTPGKINSLTPLDYDLTFGNIFHQPAIPIVGDTVQVNFTTKNIGTTTADTFVVKVYNDINQDNLPDISELIFEKEYYSLASSDSNFSQVKIYNVSLGNYYIIGKIIFNKDRDSTNNIKFYSFNVSSEAENYNDIVINEIMYAPATDKPEWVELYNRSSKSINLKNWYITDLSTQVKITSIECIVDSGEYVVISKDTSVVNYYPISSKVLITNIPALNNTGDLVRIKNSLGFVIDSVQYQPSWGGSSGNKSLERIDVNSESNVWSNWSTSVNPLGATPGIKNSITPKDYDIKIKSISIIPQNPEKEDTVNITLKILNTGLNKANNYNVKIFNDSNHDSIGQVNEILLNYDYTNLFVGDSNIVVTQLFNVDTGYYYLIAKVDFALDEDTTNNILFYQFYVNPKSENFNDIVINEIMYSPKTNEPEWIEIYNRSNITINLRNWKVSDRTSTGTITTNNLIISPDEYVILTDDSSVVNFYPITSKIIPMNLPSLNDTDDKLTLKNNLNKIIDTLTYYSNWGGSRGKSLERKDAFGLSNDKNNWGTSVNILGATPGNINSITQKDYDIKIIEIKFNPENPVFGDNVKIIAEIKNTGKNANSFYIQLFEDTDHDTLKDNLLEISTLQNLAVNDSMSFQLNYTLNNFQTKKSFVIVIDAAIDNDTSNNILWKSVEPGYAKNTILINEVMYNPATGETEWIEFVNNSNRNINIKNWMVSDVLTAPSLKTISSKDLIIAPNEYFVIAYDTLSFKFKLSAGVKLLQVKFGALGNSEDGIIITDFQGSIIDSLFYNSSWGGEKGFSLERIALTAPTLEPSNWRSSIDSLGCTPGRQNSISNISSYEFQNAVINEVMYEPNTDNSEFVEIYNRSQNAIEIGGWYLEYEDGSKILLSDYKFTLQPDKYYVVAADSSILKYYSWLNSESALQIKNTSSLSLTNSGRLVLLKDLLGNTIDSLFYLSSWHNKNINETNNKSLERINPNINSNDGMNWSTSVSTYGATPGEKNSIYTVNLLSSSNFTVSPNPFSPDNDGFEDFTIINYSLNQVLAQIRIKVYDSKGRLMRTVVNNQPSGSQGSIIFDGLDDDGNPLKIGIYILFIEAVNASNGTTDTFKVPVVVARKL